MRLHGAVTTRTEHFWQAVKYHPDTTIGELKELIALLQGKDWSLWLKRVEDHPEDLFAERLCGGISALQPETRAIEMALTRSSGSTG